MENIIPTITDGGAPKKKWRVARAIANVIIYIAIIAGITVGVPKFLSWYLDTPYPMATITSGSMWPALKEGDLVFIKGIHDRSQVQMGDVIVYRNRESGTFTIHRVVALADNEIITQGDANFTKDAPVRYEDVVGETFTIYGKNVRLPSAGFITMYASSKVNLKQ